ncbi:phage tail protein [Chloroflexota bacterium]
MIKDNHSALLKSSYLEYLPSLYQDDEFIGQFLLIFESVLKPLENTVDNLDLYFDPLITTEPLLPWLSSWLDLALDITWPVKRRRELVRSCVKLYRWRGTKRGLSEYLRIYTGTVPEISEYVLGMRLERETKLGIDTKLGSSGIGHHFTVTLDLDEDDAVSIDTVREIIEAQKPAHTVYTLDTRRKGERRDGRSEA